MSTIILKENLMSALSVAIKEREKLEKELKYSASSAFLAGLKINLEELEAGANLTIL